MVVNDRDRDRESQSITAFERDTLMALSANEPSTGAEAISILREYYGDSFDSARFYMATRKLENYGFIEIWPGPDRRSKHYIPTDRGSRRVEGYVDWLQNVRSGAYSEQASEQPDE